MVGRSRYGFAKRKGKVFAIPSEQRILRRILEERKNGETYEAISEGLNADMIPAQGNGPWYPDTIRESILKIGD